MKTRYLSSIVGDPICDLSASLSPASHGIPGWTCYNGYPTSPICNKTISSWGGLNCSSNGDIIRIYLRSRGLSGTIPSSIGSILSLTYVSLGFNNIDGTIPPQLFHLTKLGFLGLSGNFISGTISSEIGLLSHITQLSLYQNNLNGTVPSEIGKLTRMSVLALARNKLTGRLPSTLQKLSYLYVVTFGTNSFTGTIPTFFGYYHNLIMLGLLNNKFTGTIPSVLSLLPSLQVLSLNNNYLTGMIPSWLSTMSTLQNICLSYNQLTGTIPTSIGELTNMLYLLLDRNLLTGTFPSSITKMHSLQLLDISHNMLTGIVPTLHSMSAIQFIRLDDNRFQGSLSNLFPSSSALQFLDVSNNQFSGILPTDIFGSTRLQVFAAAGNCLLSSLPQEVCHASSLSVLALDGLHASTYCKLPLLHITYSGSNDIPSCLLNMPNLRVLHLSGNDLSGTLPSDWAVSSSLVDLTLSHNLLRGTIPLSIQHHMWNVLDLSFNKLGGTVAEGISVNPNGSLSLSINRLSGYVPSSLLPASYISILRGNVFACDFNQKSLPTNDPAASSYSCGSDQLQLSFYLWSVVPLLVMVSYCFSLLLGASYWDAVNKLYDDLFTTFKTSNNTSILDAVVAELRLLCLVIAVVLILVFFPVYISLEYFYSSHAYRYAWTVSVAFLSGTIPAVVLLIGWIIFIYIVFSMLRKTYVSENVILPNANPSTDIRLCLRLRCCGRRAILGLLLQLIINIAFVLPINAAYVYTAVTVNTAQKLALQLLLGLFKIAWGGIFVKNIGKLQKFVTGSEDSNVFGDTVTTTIILVSNAIIIPTIAQAAVDPSCFFTLLFPPPPISVSYSYGQICWSTFLGICSYLEVDLLTKYSPPFTYSYQCSSALLVNYSSVFVYMFLGIFLWALIKLILSKLRNCPSYFRWIIYQDSTTRELQFNFPVYISTCMCYVVILLTFGVTYPPLGVVICVTVILDTSVTQHILKSVAFGGDGSSVRILAAIANILYFVPVFYGVFLFDMVGDEKGALFALWAPLSIFCVPLCYSGLEFIMAISCPYIKEHISIAPTSVSSRNFDASTVRVGCVDVYLAHDIVPPESCQL